MGTVVPGQPYTDPTPDQFVPVLNANNSKGDASPKVLLTADAAKVITNTTTEQSVIPGVASDRTLPADFFKLKRCLRVKIAGTYQTPAIPGGVTIRIKLNGTTLATTTVSGTVLSANSSVNRFSGEGHITCRSTGPSGQVVVDAGLLFSIVSGSVPTSATADLTNGGAPVTIDTTVAQVFDVTTSWGNAQVGQGTTTTSFSLEVLN